MNWFQKLRSAFGHKPDHFIGVDMASGPDKSAIGFKAPVELDDGCICFEDAVPTPGGIIWVKDECPVHGRFNKRGKS